MTEKILTIAIPCYNSQDYVRRALDSVVPAGERLEVLVVDDGSTDGTAAIAKEYEEKYPDVVRYLYKENGGHGDAVMYGVANATGFYYRVLDSDDWCNTENLIRMIDRLSEEKASGTTFDMVLTNYVYEHVGEKPKEIGYAHALPVEIPFGWEDSKKFNLGQNILMHSISYRLELIRSCGLRLPKHTFYVDNLYAFYPLPFVKKIFYFNFDLYHYFIGREDQSVNESVMFRRIDQQEQISYTMFGMHDLDRVESPKLRRYMSQYMAVMCAIVSALYVRRGDKASIEAKKAFWSKTKTRYQGAYKYMRKIFGVRILARTNFLTNGIIRLGYVIARKIYHFN
ncbi:MAG: glycosyltransferase family 2 protein [Lachnospiraceae bacterium]|nr:glycosyltransferase family 2 protein [Lachnospiraceae bacterium]